MLSQTQTFDIQTGDFAQILNTGGHWVTVQQGLPVEVMTLRSTTSCMLPMSTKECIAGIVFTSKNAFRLQFKDVQRHVRYQLSDKLGISVVTSSSSILFVK